MQSIPKAVQEVLERLESAGFEAWCVGGCVRDTLLGRTPADWDITTNALPDAVCALFGQRAVPTGLQHGTVTIRMDCGGVEVTTYRTDGPYSDHRHPSSVTFSPSLTEDLQRRDFTVNAMAMDLRGALADPYQGQADLKGRVLRCVSDPDTRFQEDALRIMRCLRFAAVLGFSVESATGESLLRNRTLLGRIAAERLRDELLRLICGPCMAPVLLQWAEVLGVFLPELLPTVGLDQRNRHHCYSVWEHTVHGMEAIAPDPVLRTAMLLHDLGKPACFTIDERGCGHFYGHPQVSRQMAEEILRRLRFDRRSSQQILTLVEWHDRVIPRTPKGVRRALNQLGEEMLRQLLEIKRADNLAQAPAYRSAQAEITLSEEILNRLLAENACFSLAQLSVNGRDLEQFGFQGRALGQVLQELLRQVVDGELPNDREVLLQAAKQADKTCFGL